MRTRIALGALTVSLPLALAGCSGGLGVDADGTGGGGGTTSGGGGDTADGAGGDEASGGHTGTGGGAPGVGGGGPNCVEDALAGACLEPIACDETASPFGGGEGSADAPYRICSLAQLQAMVDVETGTGKHFVLARSLDLSDVVGFVPLEDEDGHFLGTFDGAGHALVGLTIDQPEEGDVGLFANLEWDSEVRHLKLYDFTVRGAADVGILVGYSEGHVLDVHTSGSVEASDVLAGGIAGAHIGTMESSSASADIVAPDRAGGLTGFSEGSILDCDASGSVTGGGTLGGLVGATLSNAVISDSRSSVTVQGEANVGGLVGSGEGQIISCEASGDVLATGSGVGGLVGGMTDGVIQASRATGDVEGEMMVGGLVGWARKFSVEILVEDCEATGEVTGLDMRVGGLIGDAGTGTIARSRATGSVTAGGSAVGGLVGTAYATTVESSAALGEVVGYGAVGGLIGEGDVSSFVRRSYATGDVTGVGGLGGLIGTSSGGEVEQCYSLGLVSGSLDPAYYVGGLIGGNIGGDLLPVVTDSYYREQGLPSAGGTALPLAAFADQASFVGWDFSATWAMSAELGGPVLAWE